MNVLRSAIQGRDITSEKALNQKTLDDNTVTGDCKVFLVCDEGRKLRELMSTKKIENLRSVISNITDKLTALNASLSAIDKKNLNTLTTCETGLKTYDAFVVESVKQYKKKDGDIVPANVSCYVSTKNKDGTFSQLEGLITGIVMSEAKIIINYSTKKNIYVEMKHICISDKDIKSDSRGCNLLNSTDSTSPVVAPVPVPQIRGGATASHSKKPVSDVTSDYSHCE